VAAKHLARKDSKVVGLVGAGAQARTQLAALLSLYKEIGEVRVWSRTRKTRETYVAEMKPKHGNVNTMVAVKDIKDAVEGSDIVVTTTPSIKPIVLNNWVEEGMHFNCIGADAPGKEELDPAILKRAKIVVDDWEQASHSGEINVPLSKGILTRNDIFGEIGEVVAGSKLGRTSPEEITLFTSTGLAVQDAVTAELAYKKAKARQIGESVNIV
jgi:alanine dehydrogenase